jgi:serine/threonine protein phosphatase 1
MDWSDIMAILFVFSDCHGFFNELKDALDEAGFDPNNEEHFCIGLGDYLDRGRQPQEVIDYLMSLERCLLVKGNHTSLLMDCLDRQFPYKTDWHNGTAQTILDLAPHAKTFGEACAVAYEKVKPLVDKMVDYVESRNYIFVHSFVPLKSLDGLPMYYTRNRKFEIDPDWRHAHASAWEEARWGNPFQLAKQGFLPDKTLVFGHWSTYDQRSRDYEGDDLFDPIYGDGYIGIDGTTALSGQVNVLVIEDEFMEG